MKHNLQRVAGTQLTWECTVCKRWYHDKAVLEKSQCPNKVIVSEPTREEKCRVIAEWMDIKHRYTYHEIAVGKLPLDCLNCGMSKRWGSGWDTPEPLCRPDFYRSEEASALALEKMPHIDLQHFTNSYFLSGEVKTPAHWICKPNRYDFKAPRTSTDVFVSDPDRKTAIAESAYLCALQERKP